MATKTKKVAGKAKKTRSRPQIAPSGRHRRRQGADLEPVVPGSRDMTANERQGALRILSAVAVRASIAARLGKTFSDDRDIYAALGYPKEPSYTDYQARYYRQDVARAIIDAPVRACWRRPPRITEAAEKQTPFEAAWLDLVEKVQPYHYFSRVDRLASIGTYAVLLLGLDDQGELKAETGSARRLLFLAPYGQDNAAIATYEKDAKNERYGLPTEYSLNMKMAGVDTGASVIANRVHWTRIIHVAEDCLEDNVEGLPRLQAVLNRLIDLERVAGGSSEMFWRGAFPGYGFKLDPDASLGVQDETALEQEIEEYMHGMKRYMRLQGLSVEDLAMQVADPSQHVSVTLDLIACAIRIPKRILLGSERGELASSQDERAWAERIDERRREHCEALILRPFIDRLIMVGALPTPSDGYVIEWPDLMAPTDRQIAEVGELRSKALKNYADSLGAPDILPPEVFLRKVLGLSDDEINQIELMVEEGDGGQTEEEEE